LFSFPCSSVGLLLTQVFYGSLAEGVPSFVHPFTGRAPGLGSPLFPFPPCRPGELSHHLMCAFLYSSPTTGFPPFLHCQPLFITSVNFNPESRLLFTVLVLPTEEEPGLKLADFSPSHCVFSSRPNLGARERYHLLLRSPAPPSWVLQLAVRDPFFFWHDRGCLGSKPCGDSWVWWFWGVREEREFAGGTLRRGGPKLYHVFRQPWPWSFRLASPPFFRCVMPLPERNTSPERGDDPSEKPYSLLRRSPRP